MIIIHAEIECKDRPDRKAIEAIVKIIEKQLIHNCKPEDTSQTFRVTVYPYQEIETMTPERKTELETLVKEIMLDAQEYTEGKANPCNIEYQTGRIVELMGDKDKQIATLQNTLGRLETELTEAEKTDEDHTIRQHNAELIADNAELIAQQDLDYAHISQQKAGIINLGQENADLTNQLKEAHNVNESLQNEIECPHVPDLLNENALKLAAHRQAIKDLEAEREDLKLYLD